MSVRPKKEKKQSKSPAGMTEKELKDLKKKLLKAKYDDMSMPPDRRSKEQKLKDAIDALLSKGEIVKKYKGGLMVKPKAAKRGY